MAAEPDRNGIMLLRLDESCVVAVGDDDVAAVREELRGLDPADVFTAHMARRLAGADAAVHGPSWHGYVTPRTFRGAPDPAVVRLDPADRRLTNFLRAAGQAGWAESGFPREPGAASRATTAFFGLLDEGDLVAAGNMTEWRDTPADIGLLTRGDARRRGLATRLAGAMTAECLPAAQIIRYRALVTNTSSLGIARRLGFEPYGSNYVTRLARLSTASIPETTTTVQIADGAT